MSPKNVVKVSAGFQIGALSVTPAKFKANTAGDITQTSRHRALLPIWREDVPDDLSALLTRVGRELVACELRPPEVADDAPEKWIGKVSIVKRALVPQKSIDRGVNLRLVVALESDTLDEISELWAVWRGMFSAQISEAIVTFSVVQLDFGDVEA